MFLFLFWKIFPTFLKTFSLSKHFAKWRFLLAVAISSWDVIGLLPLVGSQRCPERVYDKTFQSFGDKTTLSKSFDSSFSQSNVGTFSHVSTSCGLSKRRISAVFSCFDQSLILPVQPYKEVRQYYLLIPNIKMWNNYNHNSSKNFFFQNAETTTH